jgi:hypothetical protein
MKILFLDHQGVIYLGKAIWPDGKPILLDFDQGAVSILNEIIREVDCEIVVSSDWKTWADLPKMKSFYIKQGIIKSPIGYTPITNIKYLDDIAYLRAKEIKKWLDSTGNITSWVAIDDLDMGKHLSNFVWIEDSKKGIKEEGIKKRIIDYLYKFTETPGHL